MDTELVRTYLMVLNMGSFISAAERLHVSQSTVSTRIRILEERLGARLFVRNKGGAKLTDEGRRFHKHAAAIVRSVEAARHEVGVPSHYASSLTIGGRFGVWEQLLLQWLPELRRQLPDIAIRAQIGFEDELMHGLAEGQIDIAVMYTPESRTGLVVEQLVDEQLVLTGTGRPPAMPADESYVFIDWGTAFRSAHSVSFPDYTGAGLTASIGWLGLQLILSSGGSGYFPKSVVTDYVANGQLHVHPEAPRFELNAYLVYLRERESSVLDAAIAGIRNAALNL
ncbi:LysR family transcriptional regulator [Sediminicurvatus halobius]|uniref:LysR family transcriptional regulator n=1 Tax=Sediminicurvatus halobius TaxID=2182432 RepID=A0A2U2MWY1_9GAMM|nr:LysR family transcriptional regulator [Spiribacter halobius]PWG61371.1 LysR family transcriptional regulator [Spiribacter halobius]UEX76586.1 LysR family transcriptional regulator [Spiribacter halobius]